MNIFFDLAGYEFKKVMWKKRTLIVLSVVILLSAVSVFGTVMGTIYYPDPDGGERVVLAYEDEMLDRQYGEALSGRAVDADLIMEAVEAYKKMPLDKGWQYLFTKEYQQYARKYSAVYQLVSAFAGLDVEDFQRLTRGEAEQFDEIRRTKREEVIENSEISAGLKRYWRECLDRLPDTLTYEYYGGYYRFIIILYSTGLLAGAALTVIFSSLFSQEYTSGADALILSAKHGRGLVTGAKLFVAFTVSVLWSVLLVFLCYVEAMLIWGGSGADASMAILLRGFPYPITIGQCALFYAVSIVMACLFFSAITSLFSALFKTPFNTVVVMAILLIVPVFMDLGGAPVWVHNLCSLLPTNMMEFSLVMGEYQFDIFGIIVPRYIFMPVFAAAASCVCAFFAYMLFKKCRAK